MRKIINSPDRIVDEAMEGFIAAYGKYYVKHPSVNGVILRERRKDKVALVIGGGSGHEPMFAGFVGKGLADAAACGNIFASPDPNTIYRTAQAVNEGRGILFVYGCYAGDNLNFDMAEEFLQERGIATEHVRVQDDVASAPRENRAQRRGIAGDLFVVKIAGAVCDAGEDLETVVRATEKARDNTFSIGIATSPAQLPGSEEPIFQLPEGEIEYGMGIHGERGVLRREWEDADQMTDRMMEQLLEESGICAGDEVCVLINSLGSTTVLELSIVYRRVSRILRDHGVSVYDAELNDYCTSQEMGGFSITLFKLDDELKGYYDMPCHCPYYTKGVWQGAETSEDAGEIYEEPEFDETDLTEPEIRRSRAGALEELNAEDARNLLLYVAERVISGKDMLTEIDSAIGDGDHGIGMAGGMQKVRRRLAHPEFTENVYEVFAAAGRAMLLSMGGASGVIFGSLFLAGSSDREAKTLLTAEDFAAMMRRSLAAIQERGGAQAGDKTMVDALAPAVEAMETCSREGFPKMMRKAVQAAKQGAEDTKNYTAKYGRARALGERALGYPDAGAVSVCLILEAMCEFIEDAMK